MRRINFKILLISVFAVLLNTMVYAQENKSKNVSLQDAEVNSSESQIEVAFPFVLNPIEVPVGGIRKIRIVEFPAGYNKISINYDRNGVLQYLDASLDDSGTIIILTGYKISDNISILCTAIQSEVASTNTSLSKEILPASAITSTLVVKVVK